MIIKKIKNNNKKNDTNKNDDDDDDDDDDDASHATQSYITPGEPQLMVTRSGLNHAPRRGQRCSVKHTTWQHPIHKEIADIGLLLAKLCQKMCYISQPYDKNREEE